MSSFKRNRDIPKITEKGNKIISNAEDVTITKYIEPTKVTTVPFTQEMSDMLEKIFNHFEGNISRRKLCAKYLFNALKTELKNLNL